MTLATDQLERLAIDTIRTLAIDGVQQANSGHPGAPMGMAPMAYTLWTRHLRHAPTNPAWPDRDRFVLSAGHASMLLYSLLYLTGYGVELDDLRQFRQWGSITPGHPEYGLTPGVEGTTGPLGQGLANAVGMAIAERRLAFEFNRPGHDIVDHRTYAIVLRRRPPGGRRVRGELARGAPAPRQADRALRRQPDPARRADGLGVQRGRARAVRRLRVAHPARRGRQRRRGDRPRRSTPRRRTTGRRSSPSARTSATARRTSRTPRRRTARRSAPTRSASPRRPTAGTPTRRSSCPTMRSRCSGARSTRVARPSRHGSRGWRRTPTRSRPRRRSSSGGSPGGSRTGWDAGLPAYETGTEVATRNASQDAIQALAGPVPELFGGSADLSESNLTDVKANGHDHFEADHPGRNLRFGVREHGMGSISNGIEYHGGFLPYCATFLTFSDYMRGAVRLAALSELHVDLRLDARLGRAGRGRADAPAGRALRGAARDPEPVVRAAGRRQRDHRGLVARGGAARRSRARCRGPWRSR